MPQKRSIQKNLKRIGILTMSVFLLMMGVLYTFQERLIFLPTKLSKDHSYTFEEPFKELTLSTEDGALLNALHFTRKSPRGIIVYFHGNAGNLERWGEVVQFFAKKNWEVLVMDYRGYGKSTGKRSESALFSDAQMFYEYALDHFDESNVVVYGRSLGTAIATKVASQNTPGQLILETPFYSLYDVAKQRFPLLPLKPLLKYQFDTYAYVKDVSSPVTIIHGTDDTVVPLFSGRKLFDSIPNSHKKMIVVQGGMHNNLIEFQKYQEEIDALLGIKNI